MEEECVTTFCPRCGKPIVWQRQIIGNYDHYEQEVIAWACFCELSEEEWTDLFEQAAEVFNSRE